VDFHISGLYGPLIKSAFTD